ncbi:MAG: hypothetical protein ABIS68_04110 [Casimicrobiaceae bacterium]
MNQRPGEGLAEALAACGIPVGLAQRCTAGIEQGKILLGVIPRNTADANALADDWAREKGDVIAR